MSIIDWFVVTAIALCVYMLIDAGRRLKSAREINADSEECLQRSRELAESADQIMTMPLCEVEHAAVMLRPGQIYRFWPSGTCETCARMADEARKVYGEPKE